ncbi:hypothetical protein [Citrobacter portucalensis]|uniref:hypothetical protein n=1 Tax=Citrobacter portucalensis TaxID=1639133 RepID=UPI0018AA034B|nr:hypothetical protein [Citrobacter portucalensis]UKK90262.1 hypothetical protein L6310_09115 [Citrobacter portucalensis]
MEKKKLLKISIFINIMIFLAFPLGSGSVIKYISMTLMLIIFISARNNNLSRDSIILYATLLLSLSLSYMHFTISEMFYIESFTLFQSLIVSILIFYIIHTSYINKVVTFPELSKYAITGIVIYSIFKLLISFLIFFGFADISILQEISPDYNSLGFIGVSGFNRIVGVNDFLLPFLYFLIPSSSIKNKKIVAAIFIFSIFVTFTRSLWFSFILLYVIDEVIIKKKIHYAVLLFSLFIVMVYYISLYTDIDLAGSIGNRLFNEGALSSNVKFEQAYKMIDQIGYSPLFGQGLGSYIEDYIRNDRLKYGYEVMILALIMQNGLIISAGIILILALSLYRAYRINGKFFDLFALMLFLLSGLTNPVIISSVSVYLYILYAAKFTYMQNELNTKNEM